MAEYGPIKPTEYQTLLQDSDQTIGITHHATGLGKLKVVDGGPNMRST